ncbi:thioredoxin-like protein [Syncephalis plumigaleata]|nr:thioredoxin-like protein [Syncephalis plumigaleata]
MHFALRLFIYFSFFAAVTLTLRHLTSVQSDSLPYDKVPHPIDEPLQRTKFSHEFAQSANKRNVEQSVLDMMPIEGMSIEAEIEHRIKSHPVLVFSKTYCPYSVRAKKILNRYPDMDPKYFTIEVDLRPDADGIKEYLIKKTGQDTFPNIFIDGKSVGGSDKLASMEADGSLSTQLHKAGLIR